MSASRVERIRHDRRAKEAANEQRQDDARDYGSGGGFHGLKLPTLAQVVESALLQGRIVEIAENLHRRELNEIERAELVVDWVRITEERREAEADVAPSWRKTNGLLDGGVRRRARELGVPEQTVRRSLKVAGLLPEAKGSD